MGPWDSAPHPELDALRLLDLYSRAFGLEIRAARGDWTVTGPDLPEPVKIGSYTELAAWLAKTYGWPVPVPGDEQ
ncbi:MAG TPA: hypothetical protein VFO01_11525 [Trebonia sp.]|nr:hypothetical protein [Trebonia sp.]